MHKKEELVVKATNFFVIAGNLYKIGSDEFLHRYVPDYESKIILVEAHRGVAGGNYEGREIA